MSITYLIYDNPIRVIGKTYCSMKIAKVYAPAFMPRSWKVSEHILPLNLSTAMYGETSARDNNHTITMTFLAFLVVG
jgi:hypothetical protein